MKRVRSTLVVAMVLTCVIGIAAPSPAKKFQGAVTADHLFGTNRKDFINGINGDDALLGRKGNDTIYGGAGDDLVVGGKGKDFMTGGPDDDVMIDTDGQAHDEFLAFDDTDILITLDGKKDVLDCGGGTDIAVADAIDDVTVCETVFTVNGQTEGLGKLFIGTDDDDSYNGIATEDYAFGGKGDDDIDGMLGNDYLIGGKGKDSLNGNADDDTVIDEDGKSGDTLNGGSDNDIVISADGGKDTIDCGDGIDVAYVDLGRDTVSNCETVYPFP